MTEEGNTLGIKTFIFYIFQRTIFPIFILFLAISLPAITRLITSIPSLDIDQYLYEMINRVGNMAVALLFIIAMIMILIGLLLSWIKHISTRYTLDDHAFRLKEGFIAKREVSIPYKQVQNVNIDQSVFFRIVGLSRLTIFSAGEDNDSKKSDTEQVFDVIDSDIADHLKEILLEKSNVQETREVK